MFYYIYIVYISKRNLGPFILDKIHVKSKYRDISFNITIDDFFTMVSIRNDWL